MRVLSPACVLEVFMSLTALRPWAGIIVLWIVTTVTATAAESGAALTLSDALSRAIEANPDLKAFAFELPALAGRREQAGLRPNPEIGLEVENVTGSGEFRGAKSAEITLALSQLIELGGKRGLRVGVVDAAYGLAESDLAVQRLDLAAEVLRRFVQAAQNQELLALSARRIELAGRTLTTVQDRVNAALASAAEGHRATAARDRALLDRQTAERRLQSSLHRLAALWGEANPGFASVAADLYALPEVADFEALMERLGASPDLTRLLTEARLRDAELHLAEAQRRPDVTVGGGLRRLEASDDMALVFSVQMPLQIHDRNQGAIREARVRREQLDVEYEALLNRARAELFGFYQELQQARADTETLRGQVLPELEEALRQTESAYELGRYSYLELVDAQRSLIEVNGELIDAAARYHSTLAEIERITGQAIALPAY
jgi:cobalt-zinc-cadmium efflux system outer membrane protein